MPISHDKIPPSGIHIPPPPIPLPIPPPSTRAEILDAASRIVCGERDAQYGRPEDNFSRIADYWSLYLGRKITARDVAIMMCLLKLTRIQTGKPHADNWVDACGYLACGAEIEGRLQDGDTTTV